jgi:hypothetical protein
LSNAQINAFVFLNGLPSKYNTITQEYLSKTVFTAEEVYRKVQAPELIYNSSKSPSLAKNAEEGLEEDLDELKISSCACAFPCSKSSKLRSRLTAINFWHG